MELEIRARPASTRSRLAGFAGSTASTAMVIFMPARKPPNSLPPLLLLLLLVAPALAASQLASGAGARNQSRFHQGVQHHVISNRLAVEPANWSAQAKAPASLPGQLAPLDRFSLSSLLNLPLDALENREPARGTGTGAAARRGPECGQRVRTYDSRIVGGHMTTIGEFPWMISLQREKSGWFGFKAFYHSCGGTLISDSWILTAAHCLYHRNEPLRAVGGTDNLNFLYRAQVRAIARQVIHPEFDITTYNNDIALLKTVEPFDLRSTFSHMGAACLEPSLPVLAYDIVTIAGFGSRAFREKTRARLYETEIAVIEQGICNRSFGGLITDNMLCAGGMIAHKRDACSGDSGGPLLMEVANSDEDERAGQHVSLVGVVSFGNDCALQNYPGIYTRVAHYHDWILDTIDEPLVEPRNWD